MEKDPSLRITPELPPKAPELPDVSRLTESLEVAELSRAAVGKLRLAQHEWLNTLINEGIDDLGIDDVLARESSKPQVRREALKKLSEDLVSFNEVYLRQFLDGDDPAFRYRLHLLNTFSINRIDDEEWYYGERKADGTYDASKSGQEKCFVAWKKAGGKRKVAGAIDPVNADDPVDPAVDPVDPLDDPVDDPDDDAVKAEKLAKAAEKQAELAIAEGNLNTAREALAKAEVQYRTKKMFGRRGIKKSDYETLKDAYELASKNAALAGFATLKAERDANDETPFTPEELSKLAQIAFATEFGKFVDAQNNEAYMTEYGKKARAFGEVTLKRKLLRSALVLGAGAIGMATGGIFAAGFFGLASGLRIWQTKSAGTVGHGTRAGTERITKKVNKKNLEMTNTMLDLNSSDDDELLAGIVSSGHREIAERTHKSNSRRRKAVPVIIAASLAGGIAKGVSEYESSKDHFLQLKQNLTNVDWNPFRTHDVAEQASNGPSAPKKQPNTGLTFGDPEDVYRNEATPYVPKNMPAETPSGATNVVSPADVAVTTSEYQRNIENMNRLFTAPGTYPWDRAVAFYGGDAKGAQEWLNIAVEKAGARWVGSGSNSYIQLANGATDTDTVWKELTSAMLSK